MQDDMPTLMTGRDHRISMKFPRSINVAVVTLLASVFFVLACNGRFWQTFVEATGGFQVSNIPLYLNTFLIVVLLFNALLTLFYLRPVLKLVLTFLFMGTVSRCAMSHAALNILESVRGPAKRPTGMVMSAAYLLIHHVEPCSLKIQNARNRCHKCN